jgi:hypothetical protein
MKPIVDFEISYEIGDYTRALNYIRGRSFIFKYWLFFPLLFFSLLGVFWFLVAPSDFGAIFAIFWGGIILTVYLFYIRYFGNSDPFLERTIRKQFETSPLLKEPQSIFIDESGIGGSSTISQGITKWGAFIEAVETKEDFFFFTSKKFAIFIPKRVLSDADQYSLREVARNNMGQKVKF